MKKIINVVFSVFAVLVFLASADVKAQERRITRANRSRSSSGSRPAVFMIAGRACSLAMCPNIFPAILKWLCKTCRVPAD